VIVNWANLSDADLATGVNALQTQVSGDFAPFWGRDAALLPLSRSSGCGSWTWRELTPSSGGRRGVRRSAGRYPDYWALILLDEELDTASEGDPCRVYRERTRDGQPLTKVFVNRVPEGNDWCHAASRALLDMLADPYCSVTAYHHPNGAAREFNALTVCDPVAGYVDGYASSGRWVSNFTHPAYWSPGPSRPGSGIKFDERGRVSRAFQVTRSGRLGYYDFAASSWRMREGSNPVVSPPEVESRLEQRNRQTHDTPDAEAPDPVDPGPTGALYPP